MSEAKQKSRTFRRASVRIPSGKAVTHYIKRKPAKAQCGGCGDYLMGMSNTLNSRKRPIRPYGGVLCSKCTRQTITTKFRSIFSLSSK